MRRALAAAWLLGCGADLPPEHACVEAGTAMGARTEECTGDTELALSLVEAFDARVTCTIPPLPDPAREADLYECALVLRNLPCEVVVAYGEDLSLWLATSSCPTITELE